MKNKITTWWKKILLIGGVYIAWWLIFYGGLLFFLQDFFSKKPDSDSHVVAGIIIFYATVIVPFLGFYIGKKIIDMIFIKEQLFYKIISFIIFLGVMFNILSIIFIIFSGY
ncbi:MAG: hypothetical protein WCQ32_02720 [bacterium]